MQSPKKSRTFAPALEKKPESVAQQVEHIPFKDGVLGSSPSWFTERRAVLSFFVLYRSLSCSIVVYSMSVQYKVELSYLSAVGDKIYNGNLWM